MKKFLSLVLALVMTMSLVTVSAGAKDYADADSITYVEAVDVLSALGVLEGDANGFRPNDTLKRSEAAKIICALNLTPKTAAKLSADTAPFADVAATHWAAGYIAEGVKSGIIAGVGGGKFAPDAELTGYAFLKMLLVSLGYDADAEGMTGSLWTINVAKLADDRELTDGIDGFVGTKAITREEAAQLALNALNARTVKYDDGSSTTIKSGDVEVEIKTSTAKSDSDLFMDKVYEGKLVREEEKDTVDALGRPSVYWEYDGEEIGTYADTADYVLVAEEATTLADLIEDEDLDKKITTFDDEKLNAGDVVELWVSKKAATSQVIYHYELAEVTDVEDVDEDDDEALYEAGASVKYTLEAMKDGSKLIDDSITYVDELNETVKKTKAIGAFEEDDILLVTVTENGKAVAFALAETVEGEITAKSGTAIKLDGVKYPTALTTTEISALKYDDYTFAIDVNGIILGEVDSSNDDEDEELEYVYVMKRNAQDEDSNLLDDQENVAKVKVMYVDGETEVLDYALYTDKKDNVKFKVEGKEESYTASNFKDAVKEGTWYSYTTNDDDEITLGKAVKSKVSTVKDLTIEKNESKLDTGLYATTKTVVTILNKDGIVKTYTGYKKFPSTAMDLDNALIVLGSNSKYADAIYVYDKSAKEDAETIDVAMYVKTGYETEDGYEVTFYVNGKEEVYIVETAPNAAAGDLFEIEVDDDIATITALKAGEDYIEGTLDVANDEYIYVAGQEIELAEDCAVYQLSSNKKSLSDGELKEGRTVKVILNSDNEAVEIFQSKK